MSSQVGKVVARLTPFVVTCAESARIALAHAGTNLAQTIIVFTVEAGRQCWRRMPWRL